MRDPNRISPYRSPRATRSPSVSQQTMRRATYPATCTHSTRCPASVSNSAATCSFASVASGRLATRNLPGLYATAFTSPAHGVRLMCTSSGLRKMLTRTARALRNRGSSAAATASTRPSPGETTRLAPSGTRRGGLRKNHPVNTRERQEGQSFPGDRPATRPVSHRSILGLVDQLVFLEPGHHGAQPGPDLLDRMLLAALEQGVVLGAIGLALENPFLGEPPALDLLEDALHLLLGLIGDDAGPAGYVAILGRGADRVAHVGDAALVDQVHDQLHLMQALEIGHLRRIARLHQRLVPRLDERRQPPAQHHLLAEEIGLRLLAEVGLDDPGAAAADGGAVGQPDQLGVAGWVLMHGQQARHAAALRELRAHEVPRSLGGDHEHV